MIYFIGNIEENICKIGFSQRPYRRLKSLQSQVPYKLSLLETTEGNHSTEKLFHEKYSKHRIHGEWFVLSEIDFLGIKKGELFKTMKIGGIDFHINENGYFYTRTLIDELSREKLRQGKPSIDIHTVKKTDWYKSLREELINNNIDPEYQNNKNWIHQYLAFETIRHTSIKLKIELYRFLYNRFTSK